MHVKSTRKSLGLFSNPDPMCCKWHYTEIETSTPDLLLQLDANIKQE
jgi:hypothetical protein